MTQPSEMQSSTAGGRLTISAQHQYLRRLFDEKFVEGAARSVADLPSPRIAFGRLGLAGGMAALALKAGKALSNNGQTEDLD